MPLDVARKEGNAEVVEILCKTAEALNGHAGKRLPNEALLQVEQAKDQRGQWFCQDHSIHIIVTPESIGEVRQR